MHYLKNKPGACLILILVLGITVFLSAMTFGKNVSSVNNESSETVTADSQKTLKQEQVPLLAAGTGTTAKLAIQNARDGVTYSVYQIFTGTLSDDGSSLENLKYGTNYSDNIQGDDVSDSDIATILSKGYEDNITLGSVEARLTKASPSVSLPLGYYCLYGEEAYRLGFEDAIQMAAEHQLKMKKSVLNDCKRWMKRYDVKISACQSHRHIL